MLLMFLLEWIVDSNWYQKVCQFNTLPLSSLINNFGNLHMTSSTLLFNVEELTEIQETLFSFLFEASSIDEINPNIRSLHTNVLLSSISVFFCSSKAKISSSRIVIFLFYHLNYTLNLSTSMSWVIDIKICYCFFLFHFLSFLCDVRKY